MNTPHGGQEPDQKSLESIVDDLAMQFRVPPETIRPLLLCAYQELMTEAVVKDFVSIFAMRMVRDRFEAQGNGGEWHGKYRKPNPFSLKQSTNRIHI